MNIENGINVLSLFDGISIAQLALKELNQPIANYYASEIDKNAIRVTQHHFNNTIQLGCIKSIDGNSLPEIDLLIGGSPCQDLSSLRKDRRGLNGDKSSLFFHALRILNEIKPKYFLIENVKSMAQTDKNIISELLGVEPIRINSSLVGPALRDRLYWTNIPGVTLPNDRNIQLKDIIEDDYVDREKANCVLTKSLSHTKNGLIRYLTKSIGQVVFYDKEFAGFSKKEKLYRIGLMTNVEVKALFRLLSITETERLQTIQDGYVGSILKPTACKHAIGNGFTVEVIKHILTFTDMYRPNS